MKINATPPAALRLFVALVVLVVVTAPATADTADKERRWADVFGEGVKSYRQGNFREAARLFTEAAGEARRFGTTDVRLAASQSNLGIVLTKRGRYIEAEPHLKKALSIWESTYSPGNTRIADALVNLAVLYDTQGSPGVARPLRDRALVIYQQKAAPPTQPIAGRLYYAGIALIKAGTPAQAEPVLRQAESMYRTLSGPDSAAVGACQEAEAVSLLQQDRQDDALELFLTAARTFDRAGAEQVPALQSCLIESAGILKTEGKVGDAEPLLKRAFDLYESHKRTLLTSRSTPDLTMLVEGAEKGALEELDYEPTVAPADPVVPLASHDLLSLIEVYESVLKSLKESRQLADLERKTAALKNDARAYVRRLQAAIAERWTPGESAHRYKVWLSFLVLPDGSVRRLEVSKSSGAARDDAAAVDAVEQARPLPRPPASFKDGLDMQFSLEYKSR